MKIDSRIPVYILIYNRFVVIVIILAYVYKSTYVTLNIILTIQAGVKASH